MNKLKFLLLLLVIPCAFAQGQTDSSSSGDPTDPNCPCYDVQQRAEKEYQQLLMQQRQAREDSLMSLYRKEKGETKKRMKQNHKRRKKGQCPQASLAPGLLWFQSKGARI